MEYLDWLGANETELLEQLCHHEAHYFASMSQLTQTAYAYYLQQEELTEYRDINRAFHLRDSGQGAEAAVQEVLDYFQSERIPVVVDLDAVAEAQGMGAIIRQRGIMPVMGEMQLMATDTPSPTIKVPEPLSVSVVESEDDIDRWIDLVASDSEPEEYPFWQKVAQLEAHSRYTQLSLATWEGVLVGTCSLAKVEDWGRIDSVFTHPHFRRKGVGSALVQSAVQASITQGNRITYLFTERGGEGAKLYEHLGFRTLARNPFRRHLG